MSQPSLPRRKRICASFSGGRSSAEMCRQIQEEYTPRGYEIVYIMANASQEHPDTMRFARACAEHFGWDLVLVEADIQEGLGNGTGHRVVTWDTLDMDGNRFEEMVRKFGISNVVSPHCTRELKANPIHSYLRSIGWAAGTYWTAIGIRADEAQRMSKNARKSRFFYPLVASGTDKTDVIKQFEGLPFDLRILEREGNCKWCWKKSLAKHIVNIQHNPEWYEVPARLEEKYANARTDLGPEARCFFRGKRRAVDLVALAKALPVQLDLILNRSDEDAGCSESCEIQEVL